LQRNSNDENLELINQISGQEIYTVDLRNNEMRKNYVQIGNYTVLYTGIAFSGAVRTFTISDSVFTLHDTFITPYTGFSYYNITKFGTDNYIILLSSGGGFNMLIKSDPFSDPYYSNDGQIIQRSEIIELEDELKILYNTTSDNLEISFLMMPVGDFGDFEQVIFPVSRTFSKSEFHLSGDDIFIIL